VKSLTGDYAGFFTRTKTVAPNIPWTHCGMHRQGLASKRMPEGSKSVVDDVVNFIKARPTNSRIFGTLCEEMGSIQNCLLTHTEVRWLSCGKILTRISELKNEVFVSLTTHSFHKASCMQDPVLLKTGLFGKYFLGINVLNLSPQGFSMCRTEMNHSQTS
jgi:hypothetical protein